MKTFDFYLKKNLSNKSQECDQTLKKKQFILKKKLNFLKFIIKNFR